jgi:hypothetical protein
MNFSMLLGFGVEWFIWHSLEFLGTMAFQGFSEEDDLLRVREAVSSLRTHHLERLKYERTGVVHLLNRVAHRS